MLEGNVTWMTCAYQYCPVHFVTCYLPPYKNDQTRQMVNRVKHIVMSIFQKWKQSKVVLMGDFIFWIEEVQNFMASYGLLPTFDKEMSTHQAGNQLDQIFTNLEVVNANLIEV